MTLSGQALFYDHLQKSYPRPSGSRMFITFSLLLINVIPMLHKKKRERPRFILSDRKFQKEKFWILFFEGKVVFQTCSKVIPNPDILLKTSHQQNHFNFLGIVNAIFIQLVVNKVNEIFILYGDIFFLVSNKKNQELKNPKFESPEIFLIHAS